MALTPSGLSSLVFLDHCAVFPTAAAFKRQNAETGVPPHIPSQAFIEALCNATVTAVKSLTILDLGGGAVDVPGISPPVPFSFPAISAAQAFLIAQQGWTGRDSSKAAGIFVGSVLTNVMKLGLLKMNPHALMGTGTGIVSPASNPALQAAAEAAINSAIAPAFQATGKFGTNDVPGTAVNPVLLKTLPAYAAALAKGIASITATVVYTGNNSTPSAIAGTPNTGLIL